MHLCRQTASQILLHPTQTTVACSPLVFSAASYPSDPSSPTDPFLEQSDFTSMCFLVKSLSRVRLFETAWIVAYQAPLSMGFSRQELVFC